METREKLTEDTLFLACTRPAMIAGVTVEAMGINVMASSIVFIIFNNIFYVSIGVAAHFIMKEIIKHDHNKFRILVAWLNTRGKARNNTRWGGNSVSPLRLIRNYKEMK